jgi:hypothetical protein
MSWLFISYDPSLAPSLKAVAPKRLVVAIGTTSPVSARAFLKSDDLVPLDRGGVDGHQVVVVEHDTSFYLGCKLLIVQARVVERHAQRPVAGVLPVYTLGVHTPAVSWLEGVQAQDLGTYQAKKGEPYGSPFIV